MSADSDGPDDDPYAFKFKFKDRSTIQQLYRCTSPTCRHEFSVEYETNDPRVKWLNCPRCRQGLGLTIQQMAESNRGAHAVITDNPNKVVVNMKDHDPKNRR